MASAVAVVRRAWAEGIRPDPVLTVSQWADRHRRLPKKSSAEPGPWRTSRTPYLREIMDGLSSMSDVEEIVFMKAAQIAGTEAMLNGLGYVIDHSPGPTMFVQPTIELAKRFSRQRVEPLIAGTPRLRQRVLPARSRDSGNTVLSKEFPGGQLIITGANSAVGLRSMPAAYLFMDEIDGWPLDVDEEGSPVELAEARQRTFARRKRIKVSTPTIAGKSAIEEAYKSTDQRRYYVPCPDCGEMQPLEFGQLRWTEFGLEPDDAVYLCRACEAPIPHHAKKVMLDAGEWRPENPEPTNPRSRGYHLSALYAPLGWISWGEIARQFVQTHKNPEKFRVFVNTVLGEVWKEKGDAPEWRPLYDRREDYEIGTVPDGVLFLTAGCDVQRDRLLVEVVGWGRGKSSWSITREMYAGQTTDLEHGPWAELATLLDRTFAHPSGLQLPIRMLAVDSGDNTQTVYAWARKFPVSRVIAVKGFGYGSVMVSAPTRVDVTLDGKKLAGGARMWPVNVNMAKDELYGLLRLEPPTDDGPFPSGYCHFPQHPEEFFKELTSEQLVSRRTRKGYIRMEWEVIPGRQNHSLDVRVYARCAAFLCGLDRLKEQDFERLERELAEAAAEMASPTPPSTPPRPASFLGQRGRDFWRGRR